MQIIINEKILSIPPYISTGWDNVCSIHVENETSQQTLVITLQNNTVVKLPDMRPDLVTKIFQKHSEYLELKTKIGKAAPINPMENIFNMDNMMGMSGNGPIKMGIGLEGIGQAMQHNPDQANAPDIPNEILEKISQVSKIMGGEAVLAEALKPEPHCNCMHCQLARAISGQSKEEDKTIEEEVSDEDLTFKSWDIEQAGEKLYTVINPLDHKEQYSVFLGEPLGCTCGHKSCEHIKAVLNS